MVQAHAVSETGPVRSINEDSALVDPELRLFAVADGLGGHNAGEVASAMALEALAGFIRRSAGETDLSWPYGVEPHLSYDANRLRTGIHVANRRVFRAAESSDDYVGMGTTVAALLITDGQVICGSVGDSRIYRLSGGALTLLTHDDSWAAALLAQGVAQEDIGRHPLRHVLTNVVGARDQVDVHLHELPAVRGDRYLACSDGIHEVVPEPDLARLLSDEAEVRVSAERLVRLALDRGSRDNVTAVVVRCGGRG